MLAGVLIALAAIGWASFERARVPEPPTGLFTGLPLVWQQSGQVGEELRPDRPVHWARQVLDRHGGMVPLDTLDSPAAQSALARLTRLVIAQPRVLGGSENVALDEWVRRGGKLLLIVDPAYTEESAFPLGDPRRPPAAAMLSPILTRWGIELQFDDTQSSQPVMRKVMGVSVPTILAGRFATRGQSNCRLWDDGLAVTCAIGKGRVFAFADAALLERNDPDGSGARAFSALLDSAFAAR